MPMLRDRVCPEVAALPVTGLLFFLILIAAGSGQAQTVKKTVWDGAYTDAQATRGANSYSVSCMGCHGLTASGRAPLAPDALWRSFAQKSVGDLLDFTIRYMPNGNPNSLTEATYNDIVAFMLKSNGFPPGATEVSKAAAGGFEIIQKDGGKGLPNGALVHVVGCLTKQGSDWVMARGTSPERAEGSSAEADAGRALGARTFTLKYLLSSPEAWSGSRVSVKGLLIGDDGVNGINVTTIARSAAKCP